ncbi:hypothetical protein [Novipirellula herctigrandis]
MNSQLKKPPAAEVPTIILDESAKSDTGSEEAALLVAVPSSEQLDDALALIQTKVPELGTRLLPNKIPDVIAKLENLLDEFAVESDEAFVANRLIVEHTWLTEASEQVGTRVESLHKTFDFETSEFVADSFTHALPIAYLEESKVQLATNGLMMSERFLSEELTESRDQVLRLVNEIADEVDDVTTKEEASRLTQAIEQTAKLAETVSRIDFEAIESQSDADLGILGRYYCLMLRKWDKGLPWLAKTSDSRIANLARQELELIEKEQGVTASSDDWNSLADRWEIAADRTQGRAADSIRYHAITIKQRIASQPIADMLDGLEKLKQERELEELETMLPSYLRSALQRTMSGHVSEESQPSMSDPPQSLASAEESPVQWGVGMLGGVTIDGQLTTIQLIYANGSLLSSDTIDKIEEVWKVNERILLVDFAGVVRLDEETVVSVMISPYSKNRDGVVVDGTRIEFEVDSNVAQLALSSGTHTIQWRLQIDPQSNESLRIQNGVTGNDLELEHEKPVNSGSVDTANQ